MSYRNHERGWRIRVAWWPVTLWNHYPKPSQYVYPTKERVWLKPVVEIKTFFEGWVAYKDHQKELIDEN